jgi:hypothetical protein
MLSELIGTLICFTPSVGSRPRAYQPMALGPFTMNMTVRFTYPDTSLTR